MKANKQFFKIDLNCDMGEGFDANEVLIMPYISSANISCGCHAGTPEGIEKTIALAIKHGVLLGAHPSFNDRENFGRTEQKTSAKKVYQLVYEQVTSMKQLIEKQTGKLHHVKLHGALYNQTARDFELAQAASKAVFDIDPNLVFYGLAGSTHITAAEAIGLKTASEVFADRTYQSNASLTPRNQPNAMLKSVTEVLEQVQLMASEAAVFTVDGQKIKLKAETICIHGDGDTAPQLAKAIFELIRDLR